MFQKIKDVGPDTFLTFSLIKDYKRGWQLGSHQTELKLYRERKKYCMTWKRLGGEIDRISKFKL